MKTNNLKYILSSFKNVRIGKVKTIYIPIYNLYDGQSTTWHFIFYSTKNTCYISLYIFLFFQIKNKNYVTWYFVT